MESIVVLGAGYAGLRAAHTLARRGGKRVRVTLVDAEAQVVERIRLHEFAVHGSSSSFALAPALAASGIGFVQARVTALNPQAHCLELEGATGPRQLAYDRLVYAPGSRTRTDLIPGIAEHAWTLTPRRIAALHQRLHSLPAGAAVVVCGGGLTSIEQAAEIAEALPHLRVTLLSADSIGAELSARGQSAIKDALTQLGITLLEQRPASAITASSVETAAGPLPAAVCIWNGPLVAAELARTAGLRVNASGQLLVDSRLRALDDPCIYGAGDAAITEAAPGAPLTMSCQVAIPMGAYLARSVLADLSGESIRPFRMRYVALCISLGRRGALVQWTSRQRVPAAHIWRGWAAVLTKRAVVASTRVAVGLKTPLAPLPAEALSHEA